ncbi:hypothetical protein [Algisphaera agarilytica]|uniref:Uncharacterized protein n=1 Tax=Algisphaera agarilytica TaxID=1385975 RepID=A0A7X0H423_9BACT|nr:hypothetical protein [Algisphaera agarilytica]MBB6428824.1 hypothetical protein [Algisphaera agarilytica]
MSLRSYLAENNQVAVIACVVVLLLAVLLILLNLRGGTPYAETKWMYDLNTKQLVVATIDTISPDDSGGGAFDYGPLGSAGSVVDAFVYACGDPTGPKEGMTQEDLEAIDAKIAFIARYDPKGFESLTNPTEQNSGFAPNRLFSRPDAGQWFGENSGPGMQLQIDTMPSCPDGGTAVLTRP